MPRRVAAPTNEVPYLTEKRIEEEANLLLGELAERGEPVDAPPIPIDDIVEMHLGLTFEISDLQELFGVGDVHGALWVNEGRVAVDQSLDPDRNPRKLGRFRFTLGHETGHWRLHRTHYLKNEAQRALFDKQSEKPAYICRTTQRKRPVEWQADVFSANLLMPRKMVIAAWEAQHGNLEPIVLTDLRDEEKRILADMLARKRVAPTDQADVDDTLLEWCGLALAEQFQVSGEAMRIRLEGLGLLVRKKERTLF